MQRTNQIEIQQLNGHVMNRPSTLGRKETQIELREDHHHQDLEGQKIEVVTDDTKANSNGLQTITTRVYTSSNNQGKKSTAEL